MDGIKESVPIEFVGLNIVALSPLVPGAKEENLVLGLLVLDDFQGLENVLLEVLRRCVDEDTVHIAGARTAVPLWHDIGIDIFPTVLGSKTMFHHLRIVETERLELWYQLAQEDLRDTLVLACIDHLGTGTTERADRVEAKTEKVIIKLRTRLQIGQYALGATVGHALHGRGGVAHGNEVDAFEPTLLRPFTPQVHKERHIREMVWIPDEEDGLVIDGDIAMVLEGLECILEVHSVVGFAEILLFGDDDLRVCHTLAALPRLGCPVVIGPGETERKIGLTRGNDLVEWSFKQHFSIAAPVMPIGKALYACFTSQLCLFFAHLGHTQVVEAQVGRDAWLMVSLEQGLALDDVVPFGETLSPNVVVLGGWGETAVGKML